MKSILSKIFFLLRNDFCVWYKKSLPTPRPWGYFLMFSSRRFTVLTFRSMIHLELIFSVWCELGVEIHFFPQYGYPVLSAPFVGNFFLHGMALASLLKINWPVKCDSRLNSTLLTYLSILYPYHIFWIIFVSVLIFFQSCHSHCGYLYICHILDSEFQKLVQLLNCSRSQCLSVK